MIQSDDIVKVHMPSVVPSKREKATLTAKELETGVRLRPAFEIAFMSEGQQVVMPPTIHPDSGKAYKWTKYFEPKLALNFDHAMLKRPDESLSSRKLEQKEPTRTFDQKIGSNVLPEFNLTDIDVETLRVDNKIKEMIVTGEDVEDRSAALMPVAAAMYRAKHTRDEILSVLTDPDTFLGAASYHHAQTKDRRRAANWVWKYTLLKVEGQTPANKFKAPLEEPAAELDIETQQDSFNELSGFRIPGKRGGKPTPDYDALLAHFEKQYPFITITEMGVPFSFNKSHYQDLHLAFVKNFAEKHLNPRPIETERKEFYFKICANNLRPYEFFTKAAENKINFKNGVLVLDDEGFLGHQLVPHSPEFGFRTALPYSYDPKAECPLFRKWISERMGGDKSLVAILQEFMGYVVRGGEYKYHKALWLDGSGRNGKSTFIDVLKALIGRDNYSTISIKNLKERFIKSVLDGKLANFSEETTPEELRDSGPFKNITGDGDMEGEKKYGHPYTFRNRAKLIMSYNQIPDLKDDSKGMASRPLIIPFLIAIEEEDQDRNIKRKLCEELPGIFNFAMEGWERLEAQNGFTPSKAAEARKTKVQLESCNVATWVEHYVAFQFEWDPTDLDTIIRAKTIYEKYCARERYPFRMPEFFRRFNKHPQVKERWKKTEYFNGYFGMEFT